MQNIDKEAAATVTYEEFLDMAAPKVANRDEREEIQKVRAGGRGEGGLEGEEEGHGDVWRSKMRRRRSKRWGEGGKREGERGRTWRRMASWFGGWPRRE